LTDSDWRNYGNDKMKVLLELTRFGMIWKLSMGGLIEENNNGEWHIWALLKKPSMGILH
jgi:hypothetical protein